MNAKIPRRVSESDSAPKRCPLGDTGPLLPGTRERTPPVEVLPRSQPESQGTSSGFARFQDSESITFADPAPFPTGKSKPKSGSSLNSSLNCTVLPQAPSTPEPFHTLPEICPMLESSPSPPPHTRISLLGGTALPSTETPAQDRPRPSPAIGPPNDGHASFREAPPPPSTALVLLEATPPSQAVPPRVSPWR